MTTDTRGLRFDAVAILSARVEAAVWHRESLSGSAVELIVNNSLLRSGQNFDHSIDVLRFHQRMHGQSQQLPGQFLGFDAVKGAVTHVPFDSGDVANRTWVECGRADSRVPEPS